MAKKDLIERLLTARISVAEAFDHQRSHFPSNSPVAAGLCAHFGERPDEELAALNLILFLNNEQHHPQACELLALARCEYEARFGSQVWIVNAYGINPYPVE